MAEKKYPTKPKMKTYNYEADRGGFDENLMNAMEYANGVAEVAGKKSGVARTMAGGIEQKLGRKTQNIHKDETQARARIFLAVGDGLKAGKTQQQIYDDLNSKYSK